MASISIWGYELPLAVLSRDETDYLASLPRALPPVEWVWQEMDRVWQDCGLDNRQPLQAQAIGDFYAHPVWLMNGIFTQVDPVSAGHRASIARYLSQAGVRNIADFGGGFGSLALSIAYAVPDAKISIIEPYPSAVGIERVRQEPRVNFMDALGAEQYDAIVAQDVLEHVQDPIRLAAQLASALREGGIAIFANCFYPFIQCHLPSTFHFRHTFPQVMRALGLRYLGVVEGAAHAQVFRRCGSLSLSRARSAEALSRPLGQVLNFAGAAVSRTRRLVRE